ncbi:MAG: hypothetical protein QM698_15180 [Micropepsaceae bacterium]
MSVAAAATPKNALGAIAVSPDGAMVVALGDNRVLYVVDPATLEVKQRISLNLNPLEAVFSKDGQTLAVWDTDARLTFFAASDWSVKATVEGAEAVAFAADGDVVAAMGRAGYDADASTPVIIYALGDGSKKAEGSLKGKGASIVAAADGTSYAVLTERTETTAETKTDAPADLDGAAEAEFEQKNDGYASDVVRLDGSGNETGRATTWYGTYDALSGSIVDGTAYFAGYSNVNLKVTADGTASVFVLPVSYLYGFGVSRDGKTFAGGSLRDGSTYAAADGASKTFEADQREGWPEYFEGFGFAPDGSVYGGTTAYRVIHVGPDGVIRTMKPVF